MKHRNSIMLALLGASACVGDSNATNDGGVDAADDVKTPADASPDTIATDAAEASVPTTYNDVTNPQNWESYTLSDNAAFGASASGIGAHVFDKSHTVYFFPSAVYGDGVMFRYDTSQPFAAKASWNTYDLKAKVDANAGYQAGVFDGKYVYGVPFTSAKVSRYDTTSAFTDDASWTSYDISSLYSGGIGCGAFDGQYIYSTPYSTTPTVVRYDSKGAGFANASAWTTYGLGAVSANAKNLSAIGFDTRYVYMVNNIGTIVQYDTQSAFAQTSSWTTFDVTTVNSGATVFFGIVYDGRYVYFTPFASSISVRYDTTKPFAQAGSWDAFDLTTVNAAATSFEGGTFDGRYVYYAPHAYGAATQLLIRYDTMGVFADKTAWQTFDLSKVTSAANLGLYPGLTFDGASVYLIPQTNAVSATLTTVTALRFNAKTPASYPSFTPSFL